MLTEILIPSWPFIKVIQESITLLFKEYYLLKIEYTSAYDQ